MEVPRISPLIPFSAAARGNGISGQGGFIRLADSPETAMNAQRKSD